MLMVTIYRRIHWHPYNYVTVYEKNRGKGVSLNKSALRRLVE